MPKLYEYLGLTVMFYSNEHKPIHVHGKFQGKESKAEIIFENGKFKEIKITNVKGKSSLESKELKKLQALVETYKDDITKKWIDFFVYNKEIKSETISKKLN